MFSWLCVAEKYIGGDEVILHRDHFRLPVPNHIHFNIGMYAQHYRTGIGRSFQYDPLLFIYPECIRKMMPVLQAHFPTPAFHFSFLTEYVLQFGRDHVNESLDLLGELSALTKTDDAVSCFQHRQRGEKSPSKIFPHQPGNQRLKRYALLWYGDAVMHAVSEVC